MTLTEETLQFIREHRKDNVRNLALQAHKYPTVDVPAAIIQIVGRQIAEEKIRHMENSLCRKQQKYI